MSTTEDLISADWTFCHRTIADDKKLASIWLDHHGTERVFHGVPAGARPGTVWTIRCTPDGTRAAMAKPHYTGRRIDEPDRVAAWAIVDEAARIEKERAAQLRKLAGDDDAAIDRMTISELRAAMLGATRTRRIAIRAIVLDRLSA